jgi:DNA-binding NtrC family response regulator
MKNKRILCVDDNPDICSLVKILFKPVEVVTAYSLEQALTELARGASFDLVVTDYYLPDGKGTELLEATETPAIIISGDLTVCRNTGSLRARTVYKGVNFHQSLEKAVAEIFDREKV